MPIPCATCGGTGKRAPAPKEGSDRCPDCKGSGETLTALERRLAILVLIVIFGLCAVAVGMLRSGAAVLILAEQGLPSGIGI